MIALLKTMNPRNFSAVFFSSLVVLFLFTPSMAQTNPGRLRGKVLDPAGAVVVGASVSLTDRGGQSITTVSDKQGVYEFRSLVPGAYALKATSKGFSQFQLSDVNVGAGEQVLDVELSIEVEKQQLTVEDRTAGVEVSSANNASATVITGKALDALSDDPDDLQSDLQALAGPSAGPNGGEIYIDGFSDGKLPPKSAIREIRVNQNPFSAQYDRLGYGRVEVFTKPGTEKYHGSLMLMGNNSVFNSKSPFAPNQPSYSTQMYEGEVSGPLNKKATWYMNFERRSIGDVSVINATVLDPTFSQVPYQSAISSPRIMTEINPRLDYQLTNNNTLTARYEFERSTQENGGIGLYSMPTQAYNSISNEHNLQVSDTQIVNSRMINETRFQYVRDRSDQSPVDTSVTISVPGSFVSGGSQSGTQSNYTDRYEIQNYTSMALTRHFMRFGGRVRVTRQSNSSNALYNGVYSFNSIDSYQITESMLAQGATPSDIRLAGGGASQFVIAMGQPLTSITYADMGLYAEDDWRIRPNLTLSYGLRYETQNDINNGGSLAPRVGIAWGLGSSKGTPKTVLRAGFGIFYDRYSQNMMMQVARYNGTSQQQFIVTNPDFYPTIPNISDLVNSATSQTIYRQSPKLTAPYVMQAAITLERQVTRTATVSATYLNSRGRDQFISQNINAPLSYDLADPCASRPLGTCQNVYQYESAGEFNQQQLIANTNIRGGKFFNVFGFYTLNYANSNTSGSGSFPSQPYNISADYGRAAFSVRQRLVMGGSLNLKFRTTLSPFVIWNTGQPFNITTGKDSNGDSIFNDRPSFASNPNGPGVLYYEGTYLNPTPLPGETIIPINYGTGPGAFTFNLRVSKTFGFGKAGGGEVASSSGGHGPGGHGPGGGPGGGPGPFGRMGMGGGGGSSSRYSLTFTAQIRNLFNNVNLASPVGNMSSPVFGLSNSLAGGPFGSSAANRRIDFQVRFGF